MMNTMKKDLEDITKIKGNKWNYSENKDIYVIWKPETINFILKEKEQL